MVVVCNTNNNFLKLRDDIQCHKNRICAIINAYFRLCAENSCLKTLLMLMPTFITWDGVSKYWEILKRGNV